MEKSKIGLYFVKCDLHVHTPASHDFYPKETSPEAIVEKAIEKNMRAIAITDHNTGEWIDKVKEAAKGKPLTVFPGVEILATAGESGVHIIALFDVEKNSDHITALLGALEVDPVKFGKQEAVSPKGPAEVIRIISSEQFSGIAVLAHCASSKGVLSEMRGEPRTRIFREPGLLAVETSSTDFENKEKKEKKTRAIDLLDGHHEEYCYRKLGVYQASDNRHPEREGSHGLEGIGNTYTFFKVEEPLTIESLRQSFIDRDVRIRQSDEFTEVKTPHIKYIKINGGFFKDQTFPFHSGLNSLIGSKGAGKSLVVEALRFGFDQPPIDSEGLEDHDSKLERRIEQYGNVSIGYQDETGAIVEFSRTFDPENDNPFEEITKETINRNYPILFLSQNEIIRIARDEDQQLAFIDKFFDFHHFTEAIADHKVMLRTLDAELAQGLRAYKENKSVAAELKQVEEELKTINKSLKSEIFSEIDTAEQKKQFTGLIQQQGDYLLQAVQEFQKTIEFIEMPAVPEQLNKDQLSKQMNSALVDVKEYLVATGKDLQESTFKSLKEVAIKIDQWIPTYKGSKKKYEDFIRKEGGDVKNLERKRTNLITRKETLEKKKAKLQGEVNLVKSVKERREKILQELQQTYKEYYEMRKDRCHKFEKDSRDKLQISIEEASNRDAFREKLLELRTGTNIRENDIKRITELTTPKVFIDCIVRFSLSEKSEDLDFLISEEIKKDKIENLANHILQNCEYEDLFALQYRVDPQDRPEIKVKISKNNYRLLNEVSVGQKCTALLLMALSDGKMPIVIDQPEDSLDLKSMWSDICSIIRSDKDMRQFIFTTHNSSLAVASDTDFFIVLESDANEGRVVKTGSIDNISMREEVINYLEGGRDTYHHKYNKYDGEKQLKTMKQKNQSPLPNPSATCIKVN